MNGIKKKLVELTRLSTWYGWRLTLVSWWLTRDKAQIIFAGVLIGVLVFVPGSIYVVVHHAQLNREVQRDLKCLTRNIYHEARGEPLKGQYAVAEVTLNRVESGRFPDSVCDVVYEKRWDRIRERHVGAFSWTELETDAGVNTVAYQEARKAAEDVYYKRTQPQVEEALFYHTSSIRPSWAKHKKEVARIGEHIFYK